MDGEVQVPGLPKSLVETLDRDDIQRMEDAAQTERDGLIVRVLADTGMRVGELVRLRLNDLVERERLAFLKVRGKGDRERLVAPAPMLHRRLATPSASGPGTPPRTRCSCPAGGAG